MSENIINEMMSHHPLREVITHDVFQQMDKYRHHGIKTCLSHTMDVAVLTYSLARRMDLDVISATRGALLHDFFLYDWRYQGPRLHGFRHPRIALENAMKYFHLNHIEKDSIMRHMWPLTPVPPRYTESILVSYADKRISCSDYMASTVHGINALRSRLAHSKI